MFRSPGSSATGRLEVLARGRLTVAGVTRELPLTVAEYEAVEDAVPGDRRTPRR